MSYTHSNMDIYVNDDLTYSGAQVIDNPGRRLRIRAKVSNRPGVWTAVVDMTDAVRQPDTQGDTGVIRSWSGTVDGESITVAAIGRKRACCGRR